MLVLSRRQDQKILFPSLGITVEVIGIRGRNVKLGVDAPSSVRVIREELVGTLKDPVSADSYEPGEIKRCTSAQNDSDRSTRHKINNRLNAISLQLQIANKMIAQKEAEKGQQQIRKALADLEALEHESVNYNPPMHIDEITHASGNKQTRMTALLVEDNDNERNLLATILSMSGISVVSASDGQAALEYLENNDLPDFMLIDMQMPRLNGPQTISIIRDNKQFTDLPIYGVSGLQRSEVNIPINDRGVSGWFSKPVQAERLLEKIFADCVDESHHTVI